MVNEFMKQTCLKIMKMIFLTIKYYFVEKISEYFNFEHFFIHVFIFTLSTLCKENLYTDWLKIVTTIQPY